MERAVPSITENSETIKYNEILLLKNKMKCCAKKKLAKSKYQRQQTGKYIRILYIYFSKLCYINEFMHLS